RAGRPLAASRALHRRRYRHQGDRVSPLDIAQADAHLTANYARSPVAFVRGEGARLWDSDGVEYLDFLAGISVSSVGHCHPAVVAAIREQAASLIPVGNLY